MKRDTIALRIASASATARWGVAIIATQAAIAIAVGVAVKLLLGAAS